MSRVGNPQMLVIPYGARTFAQTWPAQFVVAPVYAPSWSLYYGNPLIPEWQRWNLPTSFVGTGSLMPVGQYVPPVVQHPF